MLDNADKQAGQREWCSAIDTYREALVVCKSTGDLQLSCTLVQCLELYLLSETVLVASKITPNIV